VSGRREPVATSAPVVSFDGVTCRYDDLLAVDGVSLQLPPGVLVGLVGPSGSGKTTIVRTMRGGLTPASGTVKVFGHDPRHMPQRDRKRLGYMPQQFSLYPDLTAEENVDFVASLFGLLFPKRRRRTREVLRAVDLWAVRGRRADRLSGGMQRRLQLASTLVHDPDLLLLDEPTAGLDPLLRARVWDEVRRLRDAGRTILVTTQYVGEAEECQVVALIVEGRLAAIGAPEDLRVQAVGGELLVVETSRELTDDQWRAMPEVKAVRPIGPRRTMLTVTSAARALPLLVERLRAQDTSVVEASEERPSFDDVFAALVHRANRDGALGAQAAGGNGFSVAATAPSAETAAPPTVAAVPPFAAPAVAPQPDAAEQRVATGVGQGGRR
jgi:ABC-2 type transport system ATP-binding protein